MLDLLAGVAELDPALDQLHALADPFELAGKELLGLHQHLLADADLAEVVQQGGVAELRHLLGAEAPVAVGPRAAAIHDLRQTDGEIGDAEGVARRRRVARLDRDDRGLHEPLEEPADRLDQVAVVDGDGRLRGERAGELLVALAVPLHRPLGLLDRRERPPEVRLAVDELEHADGLALRGAHRHHQHRLGAVAGLLVERAVDVERHAGWRVVRVRQVEDLAAQRDVSGDALARQRQVRLAERDLHRVVLGQHEDKRSRPVGRLVHEIERARVAARDLPGPGQDRVEEGVSVALGREPNADLVELEQLVLELRERPDVVDVGEGVADRAGQDRRAHARREQGVPVPRPGPRLLALDEGHDAEPAIVPAPRGGVGAEQQHRGDQRRRVGGSGQGSDVELVAEQPGGGRRRARGRVVADTAGHGTKVGLRCRRSQESAPGVPPAPWAGDPTA